MTDFLRRQTNSSLSSNEITLAGMGYAKKAEHQQALWWTSNEMQRFNVIEQKQQIYADVLIVTDSNHEVC